jgi:hypothetical protein
MPTSVDPASPRRLAGAAGLGYVLGVSIENMEILEAPTLDSPVALLLLMATGVAVLRASARPSGRAEIA